MSILSYVISRSRYNVLKQTYVHVFFSSLYFIINYYVSFKCIDIWYKIILWAFMNWYLHVIVLSYVVCMFGTNANTRWNWARAVTPDFLPGVSKRVAFFIRSTLTIPYTLLPNPKLGVYVLHVEIEVYLQRFI